jgi:hypothetical protein
MEAKVATMSKIYSAAKQKWTLGLRLHKSWRVGNEYLCPKGSFLNDIHAD